MTATIKGSSTIERIEDGEVVKVRMSLRDAIRLVSFYRDGKDDYASIVGKLCRVLSAEEVGKVYERIVEKKWEVV